MMRSRRVGWLFLVVFLGMLVVPAVALAADAAATAVAATDGPSMASAIKTLGAGLAMGLSAIAAGLAQAKIGAAGQATLAERPEERIWVITLVVLPETIVLLGFVAAILLNR